MKWSLSLFVSLALMALLVGGGPAQKAYACVGKSLVVGAIDNSQQQILAQWTVLNQQTREQLRVARRHPHAPPGGTHDVVGRRLIAGGLGLCGRNQLEPGQAGRDHRKTDQHPWAIPHEPPHPVSRR